MRPLDEQVRAQDHPAAVVVGGDTRLVEELVVAELHGVPVRVFLFAGLDAKPLERLAAGVDQSDRAEGGGRTSAEHVAQVGHGVHEVQLARLQQRRCRDRILRIRRHELQVLVVDRADRLHGRIRDRAGGVSPRFAELVLRQGQIQCCKLVLDFGDRLRELDRAGTTQPGPFDSEAEQLVEGHDAIVAHDALALRFPTEEGRLFGKHRSSRRGNRRRGSVQEAAQLRVGVGHPERTRRVARLHLQHQRIDELVQREGTDFLEQPRPRCRRAVALAEGRVGFEARLLTVGRNVKVGHGGGVRRFDRYLGMARAIAAGQRRDRTEPEVADGRSARRVDVAR